MALPDYITKDGANLHWVGDPRVLECSAHGLDLCAHMAEVDINHSKRYDFEVKTGKRIDMRGVPVARPHPIYAAENGHLFCSSDKANWCDHIKEHITQGLDSDEIFAAASPNPDQHEMYDNHLVVPVVPKYKIFAAVDLEPSVFKHEWNGSYSAILSFGTSGFIHPDGPDLIGADGSGRLGILNPGEGRMVLRQMIIDWFELELPEEGDEERVCNSRHHTHSTHLKLREAAKADKKGFAFANNWIQVFAHKCFICFEIDPNPVEEWDDDLIPGEGNPSRSNPFLSGGLIHTSKSGYHNPASLAARDYDAMKRRYKA